mmetsp:Transcript_13725/g.20703  ORF Transcript_13725/g.20703 Transcript_13725/m.20703 type:complete len:724 (-) Transcript_13725:38-2209(-)|eukprot:CAMPEP_0201546250 /NCGR_PEP_ID=MMETSP0173_2-20130828/2590_1 /ASSEMBLY_ACC=CAM_ASM_000268 /TAXON_ID=218659 /ORGANISM="Vexillifera sp., Strain DIVA3 564/2" /LENGTH=723 /DNA_ID=CAMNT_0047954857 /DNA_START=30 /DNA_END=2204 /DNA_ORIENTATION=+
MSANSKKFNPNNLENPSFIQHRLDVWDKLYGEQEKATKSNVDAQHTLKIVVTGGKEDREVSGVAGEICGKSIATELKLMQHALAVKIIAGISDEAKEGDIWDLSRPFDKEGTLSIVTFNSDEGKKVFWHSSAHILGQALEKYYAGLLCIGPPIDEGFYYDIAMQRVDQDDDAKDLPECRTSSVIVPDHFAQIKQLVNRVIRQKQPFLRLTLKKQDALEMFKYNKYKLEIIENKVPDGETCTAYRCGPLIDLCKGPHIPHTGKLKAFEITKNSACNWLGNVKNDSLQRIFAISFPDKKMLAEYKERKKQEALRDHRRIGKDQQLFFFSDLSPGSPFFLPHGVRIYNRLMDFLKREYRNRGFTEVMSPNIFDNKLFEISGHAQNYASNMFQLKVEEADWAMKPMNCPGHCLIFKSVHRSWKELPIRLADFGVLHRNELSGTLSGLTRVRRFQQDDAHIFCEHSQIKEEIKNCLEFMRHVYGIFKFDFELELSTRPEHYLGDIEVWNSAEKALEEELNQTGLDWVLNPGDGAFYGPKIDIHIRDAIGRSHQCATIQLDFQLPQRFNLEYQSSNDNAGNDGNSSSNDAASSSSQMKRPVMIHRAIYGSFERFLAILIEHTAGKWPFWVSPRQIMLVPISPDQNDYCAKLRDVLHTEGFYVDADLSGKKFQKKIREAQLAQYNYMLVVGKQEEANKTVNIRTRDNKQHGEKSIDDTIKLFHQLTQDFQ